MISFRNLYLFERNICVQGSSIQLINFVGIAPRYEDDFEATGRLFLRCMNRVMMSNEQAAEICEAAWELIEGRSLPILEQSGLTSNPTDIQFDLSMNPRCLDLDSSSNN